MKKYYYCIINSIMMQKNLTLISIILIVCIIESCQLKLSEDGAVYLKKLKNENNCYEITNGIGKDYTINANNEEFPFASFVLTGCSEPLSFNNENLLKEDSMVYNIAMKLYQSIENKETVQGLEITFQKNENSSYSKLFFYLIKNEELILYRKTKESPCVQ